MTTKVVYSPTDENRGLQKQIGCMNGIFQLFDRRYFLGQQRSSLHNHKRLLPPPGQSGKNETELKDAPEKAMEKDLKRLAKEKQRNSVESSRTSFSSTCSSTEPPSSSKSFFLEAPSPIIAIEQPTPIKPLNLRELVKDSMYRETRCVSVKTMPKDQGVNHTMKHIDSPRPLQQQKSSQRRDYIQDKSNPKFRENSWNCKEEKDAPRFSYDGRVSQNKLKSSLKLKEPPRLSLDSRESSIRCSAVESRKNFLKETQKSKVASGKIISLDQEPGSNKKPSSLIAKLMGLEELPDPSIDYQGELVKTESFKDNDLVKRIGEEVKHSQTFSSPRVSHKEAALPRLGISSNATKQPANSRLPLEPTPWRQGGKRGSQKPGLQSKESPMMTPHESPSVYGEIAKRLTELEFKKSGKDLRALKQILEAMQKTRTRLENTKQPHDFETKSSKCSPDYGIWDQHNHPVSPTIKGNSPTKKGQFPIMIIKPAKFIGKPIVSDAKEIPGLHKLRTKKFEDEGSKHLGDPSGGPLPSAEKKTNARTLGPSLSPKVPEHISGERLANSRRISGPGSPKIEHKREGLEKKSSPTSPSDFSRGRKQSMKKLIRSEGGATKTLRPKSTNSRHKDEHSGGSNRETRNLSQQSDTISMHSESNSSLASQNDTDVQKYAARLTEDSSMAELATATLEQPSPISVLDAAFYGEESPSPVKKISNAFRDYETLTFDDAEWDKEGMHHFDSCTITNGWSQFNHDKLENIRQLVDHITPLNLNPNEATTKATDKRHPDHRYITEIFLASGFLENTGSSRAAIQLHSSCHLLDPNLFHVLEKSKEYTELVDCEHHEKSLESISNERNKRKLIFDSVDEILVRNASELRAIPNKVRRLSGKKLLEAVWSEINDLQANSDNSMDDENDTLISIIRADVNNNLADWEGGDSELPGLVLDIERLIFKDLISEFVSGGGVAGRLDQSVRHCKQLFSM